MLGNAFFGPANPMNVVSIRSLSADGRALRSTADKRIAQVEVFDDLGGAEAAWRALEDSDCLATPYQSFDFLKHWQRHVGANAGAKPFIVTGFSAAGTPLFLWPLCARPVGGLICLEFLGGKHANFNMALWRRDVAATIGAAG